MKKNKKLLYNYRQLSGFCLQISMLLSSAIPLDDGLRIMAEDAQNEEEKRILTEMSDGVEAGETFGSVLEKTEKFPGYLTKMAKLGQESGTMEDIMLSLSKYYEKEYNLIQSIKNALLYPTVLVIMLLVILFILFTKVMPVFESVYEQLGTQLSPVARSAIHMGGLLSGICLAVVIILCAIVGFLYVLSTFGYNPGFVSRLIKQIKNKNKISAIIASRRFASTLALILNSGMEMEKGLDIAGELVENDNISGKISKCKEDLEAGGDYYDALKKTALFSGFHIQMIKVGIKSGHLDKVMEEVANDYGEMSDEAISNAVSNFEPTMVAVLAITVGLIMLSVMLPLAGILSSIG